MPTSYAGLANSGVGGKLEKRVGAQTCACSQQQRYRSCVLRSSIVRVFLQILVIFSYPSGQLEQLDGSPGEKRSWAPRGATKQLVSVQVPRFISLGFIETPRVHRQVVSRGGIYLSVCLSA